MDYFTIEYLSTLGGMIAAVMLIVQLTKGIIKKKFCPGYVRLYALVWAFLLQGVLLYIKVDITPESVLLAFLNALLVTSAATGLYQVATDIKAEK